jgi:hypothetical protein
MPSLLAGTLIYSPLHLTPIGMLVIKRDGRRESVKFDKVTARIEKLCYGLHMDFVSPIEVAKKVSTVSTTA